MNVKVSNANSPVWKTVTVKSHIPEALKHLDEMAHNLWWTWNTEARELFRSLDKDLWTKVDKNPIELLSRISYSTLKEMAKDEELVGRMNKVYSEFRQYVDTKPDSKRPSVAYFCMEYGLNHILKIYSGGLGVLAGDYLKEASDSNVDMCAVGFLYRYGYFTQTLSMDGQQIANYDTRARRKRQPGHRRRPLPQLSGACSHLACQRGSRVALSARHRQRDELRV